jgi:hypothetical protein
MAVSRAIIKSREVRKRQFWEQHPSSNPGRLQKFCQFNVSFVSLLEQTDVTKMITKVTLALNHCRSLRLVPPGSSQHAEPYSPRFGGVMVLTAVTTCLAKKRNRQHLSKRLYTPFIPPMA